MAQLERLEAFVNSPIIVWENLYNRLLSYGCTNPTFSDRANFRRQPLSKINKALDWWGENHRHKVIELSHTNAMGWALVANRLRTNDETPIIDAERLLPYPIPGSKKSSFSVTDRDRIICKRLSKKGLLTPRIEGILMQMGVLSNG